MTAPTPTAATPEELAEAFHDRWQGVRLGGSKTMFVNEFAAAIRQHSEAQREEIERLRVMADEPTTKRVWDGIRAMAGLFADPDHMPTVLEFKTAFDAAFVVDGKPYDVERIKAEWQADYAAMEAALAASQERERKMREALQGVIGMAENFLELHMMSKAANDPDITRARAALKQQETADVR